MPSKKKSEGRSSAKSKQTGLSPTAFGEKVKVSRQRILKAIESGVLSASVSKHKHGKNIRYLINPEVGLKEWSENIDPSKQRDQEKQKETRDMSGGKQSTYQKSKAAREYFAAKLAELDYQEKAGKLVSADQVKAETFKIGRRVRDTILGVPERISAEVAIMDDPRQISIFIKEQLALSLKDLGDLNDVAKPRA